MIWSTNNISIKFNDIEIFVNYQRNLPIIKNVVKNLIILPTYPSYDIKQMYKNISLIKKYFEYP